MYPLHSPLRFGRSYWVYCSEKNAETMLKTFQEKQEALGKPIVILQDRTHSGRTEGGKTVEEAGPVYKIYTQNHVDYAKAKKVFEEAKSSENQQYEQIRKQLQAEAEQLKADAVKNHGGEYRQLFNHAKDNPDDLAVFEKLANYPRLPERLLQIQQEMYQKIQAAASQIKKVNYADIPRQSDVALKEDYHKPGIYTATQVLALIEKERFDIDKGLIIPGWKNWFKKKPKKS